MMRGILIIIRSECERSVAVVGKTLRCHEGNRFFTPCHISAFRLSHKAFLPPFRMTADGIRRHSEGNVKRHPERT